MSLVSTTDAAAYLGIDSATSGLQEAIDNAEALVAARLGAMDLTSAEYTETRRIQSDVSNHLLRTGPAHTLTSLTLDGIDYTSQSTLDATGWAVRWEDFRPPAYDQNLTRRYGYGVKLVIIYEAGFTAGGGANPLPGHVAEYIKALTGLTMYNLMMSGVNDTKLGDMTIKIQRETMQQNLGFYEPLLAQWKRVSI